MSLLVFCAEVSSSGITSSSTTGSTVGSSSTKSLSASTSSVAASSAGPSSSGRSSGSCSSIGIGSTSVGSPSSSNASSETDSASSTPRRLAISLLIRSASPFPTSGSFPSIMSRTCGDAVAMSCSSGEISAGSVTSFSTSPSSTIGFSSTASSSAPSRRVWRFSSIALIILPLSDINNLDGSSPMISRSICFSTVRILFLSFTSSSSSKSEITEMILSVFPADSLRALTSSATVSPIADFPSSRVIFSTLGSVTSSVGFSASSSSSSSGVTGSKPMSPTSSSNASVTSFSASASSSSSTGKSSPTSATNLFASDSSSSVGSEVGSANLTVSFSSFALRAISFLTTSVYSCLFSLSAGKLPSSASFFISSKRSVYIRLLRADDSMIFSTFIFAAFFISSRFSSRRVVRVFSAHSTASGLRSSLSRYMRMVLFMIFSASVNFFQSPAICLSIVVDMFSTPCANRSVTAGGSAPSPAAPLFQIILFNNRL